MVRNGARKIEDMARQTEDTDNAINEGARSITNAIATMAREVNAKIIEASNDVKAEVQRIMQKELENRKLPRSEFEDILKISQGFFLNK